jgi:hypothetical protein
LSISVQQRDIGDGQGGPSGRRSIAHAGQGKPIETKNCSPRYAARGLLNKSFMPITAEWHRQPRGSAT